MRLVTSRPQLEGNLLFRKCSIAFDLGRSNGKAIWGDRRMRKRTRRSGADDRRIGNRSNGGHWDVLYLFIRFGLRRSRKFHRWCSPKRLQLWVRIGGIHWVKWGNAGTSDLEDATTGWRGAWKSGYDLYRGRVKPSWEAGTARVLIFFGKRAGL